MYVPGHGLIGNMALPAFLTPVLMLTLILPLIPSLPLILPLILTLPSFPIVQQNSIYPSIFHGIGCRYHLSYQYKMAYHAPFHIQYYSPSTIPALQLPFLRRALYWNRSLGRNSGGPYPIYPLRPLMVESMASISGYPILVNTHPISPFSTTGWVPVLCLGLQ